MTGALCTNVTSATTATASYCVTSVLMLHVLLQTVIEQGGIQPGGLNFDAKIRRESTDVVDLFIAHIGLLTTGVWVF